MLSTDGVSGVPIRAKGNWGFCLEDYDCKGRRCVSSPCARSRQDFWLNQISTWFSHEGYPV